MREAAVLRLSSTVASATAPIPESSSLALIRPAKFTGPLCNQIPQSPSSFFPSNPLILYSFNPLILFPRTDIEAGASLSLRNASLR